MASEAKPQRAFTLTAENQATELKLVIAPNAGPADELERNISQEAAGLAPAVALDKDALRGTCEAAAKGMQAAAVIARGVAPVNGCDGRLVWSKRITGASRQSGRFSHYLGRLEKRIVKKDEPLAKVFAETQGTDGKDIYGKVLKARKGKPLRVKAGANIREKDGIFYAEKDGLARLDGGKLVLDEVFSVDGNLTFEVGNINFPGSVVIGGGVLDLFEVKAGGSVEIGGLVEAAMITAGGDVEMKGGVEGKRKGVIRSRGSVNAKFLVNAEVYAEKDVCVETEIISSKVAALGAVKAPEGAIAGGEVAALGGIDAGTIGSESAAPTVVVAGAAYMLARTLNEAEAAVNEGKKELAAVDREIGSCRGMEPSAAAKDKLAKLEGAKAQIADRIARSERERARVLEFARSAARPVILVRKAIHPGVKIQLGNVKGSVHETLHGPLKVLADAANSVLRFVPASL